MPKITEALKLCPECYSIPGLKEKCEKCAGTGKIEPCLRCLATGSGFNAGQAYACGTCNGSGVA